MLSFAIIGISTMVVCLLLGRIGVAEVKTSWDFTLSALAYGHASREEFGEIWLREPMMLLGGAVAPVMTSLGTVMLTTVWLWRHAGSWSRRVVVRAWLLMACCWMVVQPWGAPVKFLYPYPYSRPTGVVAKLADDMVFFSASLSLMPTYTVITYLMPLGLLYATVVWLVASRGTGGQQAGA